MQQNPRTLIILISLLCAPGIISCSSSTERDKESEVASKLQALVDSCIDTAGEDPIYNAVLVVESPRLKWAGAAGMADGRNEPMTAGHKIKIASIAKTFTATVVLQLVEEGLLDLNDRIETYLDNPTVKVDSLHFYDGVAYGRQITVGQLLSHTSGIADYMEDPRFVPDVIENPTKKYNPAMILDWYYKYRTQERAAFPPGEDHYYSDVNYVLLAMLIERVTGKTYQDQLRTRIFDRLGMKNSYLEYYETPRGDESLSHAYLADIDLVDDVNTSFDWGGGGIVSTCEELTVFLRALLTGKLFSNEATLKKMLAAADEGRGGTDYAYGLGIMKKSIHGVTFYGHGGAYDCDAYYSIDKDISVCMSLNQVNTHGKRNELLFQAVKLIM